MVFCFADSRRGNGQSMTTHLAISSDFGNWAPGDSKWRDAMKMLVLPRKTLKRPDPAPTPVAQLWVDPIHPPSPLYTNPKFTVMQLTTAILSQTKHNSPLSIHTKVPKYLLSKWSETQQISNLMFSTGYLIGEMKAWLMPFRCYLGERRWQNWEWNTIFLLF